MGDIAGDWAVVLQRGKERRVRAGRGYGTVLGSNADKSLLENCGCSW